MSKAGTPGYIAPEVFENKAYTEKGDVFSLGVIFYSLVSGRSPFKGTDLYFFIDRYQLQGGNGG